jgi:hypothetical protein
MHTGKNSREEGGEGHVNSGIEGMYLIQGVQLVMCRRRRRRYDMSGGEDSTDKPLWMEGEWRGMIEGRYPMAFSLRPGGRSVECVHITG